MKEFADSKKSKQKPRKGFPKKLHSINVTLPRQEYKKAFQKTIFRNTVKEIDYAKILIIVTTPRRYGNSNWLAIDFAKGAKESATPSQLYISTIKKSLFAKVVSPAKC